MSAVSCCCSFSPLYGLSHTSAGERPFFSLPLAPHDVPVLPLVLAATLLLSLPPLLLVAVVLLVHTRVENHKSSLRAHSFSWLTRESQSASAPAGSNPSHVTAESVACLHGAAVPPFRDRPCSAAACAPRYPLDRAGEFQTFSHTPGLSLSTLSRYPSFSCYLPAAGLMAVSSFTIPPPYLYSYSSPGNKKRFPRDYNLSSRLETDIPAQRERDRR